MRQQAQQRATLQGFQCEMAARTCVRLRRETRLQLQATDSHAVANGPWCTGTAQATDADTTAQPPTTHNPGGTDESL